MANQALSDRRPWLLASIIAAVTWFFLRDGGVLTEFGGMLGGGWLMLLKGSAVALLAVYALVRHPSNDAKLLAGVMAASALGDGLVEIDWTLGGAAFFMSHLLAIALYLQNRREDLTGSQKATVTALLLGTPVISWLLTRDANIALYGLALGGMAACAWGSRFPRYRVGIGAVLFVISDFLIFARMGHPQAEELGNLLIWPIYFAGQFMICTGVIQTLRKEIS